MMVGKWHLGDAQDQWPWARGFERSFALIPGAMNYWGAAGGEKPPRMELNGERFAPPTDGSFFATDAFTDRAVEFLEQAKSAAPDKPFFLYLAYNAPHWPLHARDETIAKYRGKYADGWQATRERRYARMRELGVIGDAVALSPMDRGKQKPWNELSDAERKEWDLRMAVYAAMVEELDRGVGRVIEALDRIGAADNTLLVFTSDNGGAAEDPNRGPADAATGTRESFRGYARPWASVSNTPFTRHKVTPYEGGISAPTIVRWPAGIANDRNGGFVREPGHLLDLIPTFLHVAGIEKPDPAFKPEGISLLDPIQGRPGRSDRTFAWEHEGNRAIRQGKWKLVRLSDTTQWSLFDLESDRAEQHDLASANPQLVAELSAAYDAWAKRCGVQPWERLVARRPASAPANPKK
jgi:arylsulfatase